MLQGFKSTWDQGSRKCTSTTLSLILESSSRFPNHLLPFSRLRENWSSDSNLIRFREAIRRNNSTFWLALTHFMLQHCVARMLFSCLGLLMVDITSISYSKWGRKRGRSFEEWKKAQTKIQTDKQGKQTPKYRCSSAIPTALPQHSSC